MAIFQWKGIENNQLASGEIEAANKEQASIKLKNQKIVVTNIDLISGVEEKTEPQGEGVAPAVDPKQVVQRAINKKKFKAKNIKLKELLVFTKKLGTMVQSGLPILKTLKMLEMQQENPNFRWVVGDIANTVEQGSTLSQAFAQHPVIFDTIYISMLKAGETSGKLTLFLEKLVIQIEKVEKIRSKVKKALMYPIILLCVACGVIGIMMIKVVPVFEKMFSSMGNGLPGPTQLVVNISNFFREPMQGGLLFSGIIGGYLLMKYLIKNNEAVKRKFDAYLLKFPVIGPVIHKSTLSKIAMVQGNLAAAGVSVLDSLDIISEIVTNYVFLDAFKEVKDGVQSGNALSKLYSTCAVFPPTFHQMLAVGEETGNMDEMFEATALYYEEEFDIAVDNMTEMLEPIMIVFMGLTIGFIIVAMYMPIFQMGQMVGG